MFNAIYYNGVVIYLGRNVLIEKIKDKIAL